MGIDYLKLEQKIGQMIVAGFPSASCDGHLTKLIEYHGVGNVILFSRNLGGKGDIAQMNRSIQELLLKSVGIPGLIAVDQEGGMVTRIRRDASFLPGAMAFSAAGITGSARRAGEIEGEELRAMGINMNLAPVMDVNNNPQNPVIGVRSYGDSPVRVAEYGADYIRGLQGQGVIATAKHFPGHGDTEVDSHLGLAAVNHPPERLESVELFPFKAAVAGGVDAVMTAHILFPALEPERLPATLSHRVLSGLLRRELGFKGLIITDCLEMKAVSDNYGTANAAVMAVKAGADLLCISHSLDAQLEGLRAVKEAVRRGEIPESRIDESVERILDMKRKYGLFDLPYPDEDKLESVVGCVEHTGFAKSVSEKSITLVRDTGGLLPLKTANILAVSPEAVAVTNAEEAPDGARAFCRLVESRLGGSSVIIPLNPDPTAVKDVAARAASAEVVIAGTYNAGLNRGQAAAVNEIMKINKNVVAVALRNPYDILMFRDVPAYICAYEYTPLSADSVINVLRGSAKASGKLPVRLDL